MLSNCQWMGKSPSNARRTAAYEGASGDIVPILVAGMQPSTGYHMRATLTSAGQPVWTDQDHTFFTKPLGAVPLPAVTVTKGTAPDNNGGVEQITFGAPPGSPQVLQAFVIDHKGNPLWFYSSPGDTVLFFKIMPSGHVLANVSVGAANDSTSAKSPWPEIPFARWMRMRCNSACRAPAMI